MLCRPFAQTRSGHGGVPGTLHGPLKHEVLSDLGPHGALDSEGTRPSSRHGIDEASQQIYVWRRSNVAAT